MTVATGPTPQRLELARRAAEMRRQGALQTEIAHRLGVSRSYAQQLLNDPDGSQARARKDSYSQPCPRCGEPMTGSGGLSAVPDRCAACAASEQHEQRYWTRERIVEAFQAFAAVAGRPPASTDPHAAYNSQRFSDERRADGDTARHAVRLPHPATVKQEFGSWPAAVRAAGFDPAPTGGAGHRNVNVAAPARDAILEALTDGPKTAAELRTLRSSRYAHHAIRPLVKRGIVRRERHGMHGTIYSLTQSAQPIGEKVMAREFMVLSKNGKGWIEQGLIEAVTAEHAVEKAATEAGNYIAIPIAHWRSLEVAPVTKLGVVTSSA